MATVVGAEGVAAGCRVAATGAAVPQLWVVVARVTMVVLLVARPRLLSRCGAARVVVVLLVLLLVLLLRAGACCLLRLPCIATAHLLLKIPLTVSRSKAPAAADPAEGMGGDPVSAAAASAAGAGPCGTGCGATARDGSCGDPGRGVTAATATTATNGRCSTSRGRRCCADPLREDKRGAGTDGLPWRLLRVEQPDEAAGGGQDCQHVPLNAEQPQILNGSQMRDGSCERACVGSQVARA